jgi:hypothetical protein
MKWLRLLGSLPVILMGVIVVIVGIGSIVQVWVHYYPDENMALAIPFFIIFIGVSAGGAFLLNFGVRLFWRSMKNRQVPIG